jgi:N-acetylglucosamine-6-sulfatase
MRSNESMDSAQRARSFLLAAGTLTLAVATLAPTSSPPSPAATGPAPAPAARPNVVVIMADDMRADDMRWMPATRRLIRQHGARFTNSFSPYPLCCPARASFLNGQYTHNHGVWSTRRPYGFRSFKDRRTLPVWLRSAGYNTLFVGKYLNKYGIQPTRGGKPSVRYVPPGWTDWRASIDGGLPRTHPRAGGTYRYYDMTLNVNGALRGNQGRYSTGVVGRQSVRLIRRYADRDRPFFLWSSYVAPHHGAPREPDDPLPVRRNDGKWTRITTPAVTDGVRNRFNKQIRRPAGLPTEKDVSDKPEFIERPRINKRERRAMLEAARQRAESVWLVDRQVADTIAALRAAGELRGTIVIFTSDNGYFQGEHQQRQGKTTPYEPALRTPLLIRGPGIPHGVTRKSPFLTIDFAPTILAAAKARVPSSIDGRPRLDIAQSGGEGWRRPVLTETLYVPKSNARGPEDWISSAGVRTPGFFYTEHSTGEAELYDMRRDPAQRRNVAGRDGYAGERARLERMLDDLRECAGDTCGRPLSDW